MPGHGGAQLFVLGDDRDNSADSRYWGYVPVDDMHGRPTLIYWSSGDAGVRWNWGRRLRRAQHTGSAPYRRVESNIIPCYSSFADFSEQSHFQIKIRKC